MAMYGYTKKQLWIEDRQRILKLAKKLNGKLNDLIQKEVELSKDRGKEIKETNFGKFHWGLPPHIIVFLASKINKYKEHEKPRLL